MQAFSYLGICFSWMDLSDRMRGSMDNIQTTWIILSTVFLFVLGGIELEGRDVPMREYCDSEVFNPQCEKTQVIVITAAEYGRFKVGKCVDRNWGTGSLGCSTDVTTDVDTICSGLQTCSIKIDDELFKSRRPCPNDFKSHLRVSYKCVSVHTPTKSCHGEDTKGSIVSVAPTSPEQRRNVIGYLASDVTKQTGCGTTSVPWVIELPQGQVLRLTLYDFWLNSTSSRDEVSASSVCLVYASIKDGLGTSKRGSTVCGGKAPRISSVYTSRTNYIEIRIMQRQASNRQQQPKFIIKYEAMGCPDPPKPAFGWAHRESDNIAIAGCLDDTDVQKWSLECKGNFWKGHIGNCSGTTASLVSVPSLPYALSIVMVIAIAFVVSCIILIAGICFYKRKHSLNYPQQMPGELSVEAGSPQRQAGNKHTKYSMVAGPQENTYAGTGYLQGYSMDKGRPINDNYRFDNQNPRALMPVEPGYPSGGYYPHSEHIYECPESLNMYTGTDSESTSRQYYDLDPSTQPDAVAQRISAHASGADRAVCGHEGRCTCTGRQGNVPVANLGKNNNLASSSKPRCENSQSF